MKRKISMETSGTALKTVIARFAEVKELYSEGQMTGTDDEGEEINVNKVQAALRTVGIDMTDFFKGEEGLDSIFLQLAEKWDTLDTLTQRYIATQAAGSRQQSRFIAMLADYERLQELTASATNASGAADEQYGKTLESLETKLNKLKNAWDQFTMGIANQAVIKEAVDLLTGLIGIINTLTEKFGTVGGMIAKLALSFGALKTGKILFDSFFNGIKGIGTEGEGFGKNFVGSMKKGMAAEMPKVGSFFKSAFGDISKRINGWFVGGAAEKLFNTDDFKNSFADLDILRRDFFNSKQWNYEGLEVGQLKDQLSDIGTAFNMTEDQMRAMSRAILEGVDPITAARAALNGMTEADVEAAAATNAATVSQIANEKARESSVVTLIKEKVALIGTKVQTIASSAETAANTVVNRLNTIGLGESTAAKIANAIASKLQAVAQMSATKAALVGALAVAALAAAIWLVVKAVKYFQSMTPEAKMERAAAAAEEATKTVTELTTAYNELQTSIEDLDSGADAIDDMVRGTKEWKQAVIEQNQKVLDLIESYDGLAAFVKNENGVLTIDFDDGGVQDVIEGYQDQMLNAQAGAAGAQIDYLDRQDELAYSERSTELLQYTPKQIEKLANAIANGEAWDAASLQKFAAANAIPVTDPMNDTVLGSAAFEELRALSEDLRENEAKREVQYQTMINSATSQFDEGELDKRAEDTFANSDVMEDVYEDAEKSLGTTEQVMRDYAEQVLGLGTGEYTIDDEGLKYTNEDGEEKTVTKEQARSSMQAIEATNEMAERMEAFSTKIQSMDDTAEEAATNLFELADGAALTAEDLNNFEGKSDNELKDYFQSAEGGGWTDEEVKATYGSWDAFLENVKGSIEIATNTFADAEARLATMGVGLKNFWGKSDLTAAGLEGLVGALDQIQKVSGNGAMNQASAQFDSLVGKLEKLGLTSSQISQIFSSIDWTSEDSISTLSDLLEGMGVDCEKSGFKIEDFEDQIISLAKAADQVDISTLVEDVKTFASLLGDLKSGENTGSFTDDQYETLTSKGVAEKEDFVYNIETGNYEYTQGIDQIVSAIEQQTVDLLGGGDYENKITSGEVVSDMIETEYNGKTIEDEGFTEDSEAMYQFLNSYLDQMEAEGADAGFTQDYIDSLKALGAQGVDGLSALVQTITDDYANLAANKKALKTSQAEAEQIALQNEAPTNLSGQISDAAKAQAVENSATLNNGNALDTEQYGVSSEYANALLAQAAAAGVAAEELEKYKAKVNDANASNDQAAVRALQAQIANVKLNDGLAEITDSYDDWSTLIDKDSGLLVGKTSDEISAINSLKKSMNKMLNTTEDLSDEFWTNKENIEAMKKAAEGDTEAVEKLQKAASKDYINQIDLGAQLGGGEAVEEAKTAINDFYDWVDGINIPKLDVGVKWDGEEAEQFKSKFNEMATAANLSAEQIQSAVQSMGFSAEVEYVWETRKLPIYSQTETRKRNADGSYTLESGTPVITDYKDVDGYFPVVKTLTASGAGGGGVSTSTVKAGQGNKTGKSGGGSSSSKETEWENPYDKQYNTLEDINAELKKRERLEKRYQILCARGKDTQAMTRNYYKDLVASLEKEYDYQDKIATAKKKEIKDYLKQNKSLQKYATFNFKDLTVEIDYKAIQKVDKANNEELGQKIEEYVSKLEELRDTMEDAKDSQYDILQTLEDTKQELIDAYLDFEDRVASALQQIDQDLVDEQEKLYEAMNSAASNLVDSIRENIDATRQLRDNEDTEEQIAKKERRLAYLRLDTSGANALQIKQLEEELADEKQSYQDSLVDQALDKLQDQNDKAAEQRQRQIDLMNSQIEWNEKNAVYTQSVRDLLDKAMKGDGKLDIEDELYKVLYNGENWNSYSAEKQSEMLKQANIEAINARQGLQVIDGTHALNNTDLNYETPTRSGEIVSTKTDTGSTSKTTKTSESKTNSSSGKKKVTSTIKKGVAAAIVYGADYGGWGTGNTRKSRLNSKFVDGWDTIQGYIESEYPSYTNLRKFMNNNKISDYYFKKYKTGGLADYTGPAWLDGTKSRPEMVLNATDTQNFIQLKDILRDAINGGLNGQSSAGDYTFDIDINVEELANDYDVSQLAAQVRQELVSAMTYRNVNTIGIMR